jgi:hypothetical protein
MDPHSNAFRSSFEAVEARPNDVETPDGDEA